MKGEPPRYGLDELAELGGVSRRTVRYYIQEQLLPPPLGVGRGPHYGPEHLEALQRVKGMQEAGLTLEAIRRALSGRGPDGPRREARPTREVWRRMVMAPGIELHVRGDVRVPPATTLEGLREWCRVHLGDTGDRSHADD